MKRKSENKKKLEEVSVPAETNAQEVVNPGTEMSDEEFDRYIDGIMVESGEEEAMPVEENVSEVQARETMSDDIQSLRDDMNKVIAALNVLSSCIHKNADAAPLPVQAEQIPVGKLAAAAAAASMPAHAADTPAPAIDIAQKAKLYDSIIEERKRMDNVHSFLMSQADDIKKTYGDFDLNAFYNSDPQFKSDLDRTGSVYGAYLNYLSRGKNAPVMPNQGRSFVENGAMPSFAAGAISTSPAGLPDKEFDEYIKNILGEI